MFQFGKKNKQEQLTAAAPPKSEIQADVQAAGPQRKKKAGGKKQDYLRKRTINLMYKERNVENDPRIIAPLAVLVLAGIVWFGKVMVADKLELAAQAEANLASMRAQLEELKEENQDYEQIKEEYQRYGAVVYNDGEMNQVSVDDVIDLLERVIMTQGDIKSCVFQNNTIQLQMNDMTLDAAAKIITQLYQEPIVDDVLISTAVTENKTMNQDIVASLTITVSKPPESMELPQGEPQSKAEGEGAV